MTLGDTIGPYRVLEKLGEGGMGEVYRARDTRLNRDVALKALPESFALDPDRLMRFKREAQLLASLNHTNIAAIYGLEETDGVSALVLELVEGSTLADRIAYGPLPIDEALPIARQIADALEAAHEQGIVHRDLKPANVKLRADGAVKVLDFGLAKAMQPVTAVSPDMPAAPTITSPALTQLGVILGTAAYMSPEQAKGRPADKRSDVWAFGAVLYEMLSGQRAFKGDDLSDVLAAVLRQDVDWQSLPATLPSPVRRLIARCLDRDPKRRLRDIGEARIALDGPFEAPSIDPPVPVPLMRRALPLALAAVLGGLVTAAASWYWVRPPVVSPSVVRLSFTMPAGQSLIAPNPGHAFALSSDGQQLVYMANNRLFVRSLAYDDAHPIAGTEGYESASSPVFSPDGRSVAFFARSDRALRRIAVTGGNAVFICSIEPPYGISWSDSGILVGQGDKGIVRVSPNGGAPQLVIRVKEGEEAHGPQLLPDGQHVLFTLASGTDLYRWDRARIVVQSLTSETPTALIEGGSDARYDPTTGSIVYVDTQSLLARPFDARQRTLTGNAVPVAGLVARSAGNTTGAASFSVAGSSLVYIAASFSQTFLPTAEIRLTDRNGDVERLKLPAARYSTPRVSPDGTQLALGVQEGNLARIGVYELSGASALRLLSLKGNNRFPIWSHDSQRLTFQSDVDGDQALFQIPVNGGPIERLTKPGAGEIHEPEEWSPTGETLLYSVTSTKGRDISLWTYSLPDKAVAPFSNVHSLHPTGARFSRDGRRVAYSSRGSDRARIFVEPFPPTGEKHELVISGPIVAAHKIGWSATSDELFYIPRIREFEAVPFATRPTFKFGESRKVPRPWDYPGAPNMRTQYDITPKGKFVGLFLPGDTVGTPPPDNEIRVIVNWMEELKARR